MRPSRGADEAVKPSQLLRFVQTLDEVIQSGAFLQHLPAASSNPAAHASLRLGLPAANSTCASPVQRQQIPSPASMSSNQRNKTSKSAFKDLRKLVSRRRPKETSQPVGSEASATAGPAEPVLFQNPQGNEPRAETSVEGHAVSSMAHHSAATNACQLLGKK